MPSIDDESDMDLGGFSETDYILGSCRSDGLEKQTFNVLNRDPCRPRLFLWHRLHRQPFRARARQCLD